MTGIVLASFPLALAAQSASVGQIARHAPQPSPTPTDTPIPSPSQTPYLQNGDRAYVLIGGNWDCTTFAGTKFTRTYRRDEDAVSIIAETFVPIAGHIGKLIEVYRKHSDANKWVASLVNGKIVAVAPPWRNGDWIFDGQSSEPGRDVRVRMLYRSYNYNEFRREFDRFYGGRFQSYAGEKCERKAH